jgi:hypothetical protein
MRRSIRPACASGRRKSMRRSSRSPKWSNANFSLSKAMSTPCTICVAITGSLPTKTNNPAVPITIAEQVESTHEAFEAGATIVHGHVRDDEGRPTSDPERFALLKERIERNCPGMIVQFSTGGRSGGGIARGAMLHLRPDMASLSVRSNNFPTRVYVCGGSAGRDRRLGMPASECRPPSLVPKKSWRRVRANDFEPRLSTPQPIVTNYQRKARTSISLL